MANCTVMITVKSGDAKVTKYECDTRQGRLLPVMYATLPDRTLVLDNLAKALDLSVLFLKTVFTMIHSYIWIWQLWYG